MISTHKVQSVVKDVLLQAIIGAPASAPTLREEYAIFQILMSVEVVNTTVIKCVTISQAATNALVETDTHAYLITQRVQVRKGQSICLLFPTQRHKI